MAGSTGAIARVALVPAPANARYVTGAIVPMDGGANPIR